MYDQMAPAIACVHCPRYTSSTGVAMPKTSAAPDESLFLSWLSDNGVRWDASALDILASLREQDSSPDRVLAQAMLLHCTID